MSAFVVSRDHITALIHAGMVLPVHGTHLRWDRTNGAARVAYFASDATDAEKMDFLRSDRETLEVMTADSAGQMLLDENVRSVNYRYQDHGDPETADVYTFPMSGHFYWPRPDPVAVLKAIDCYEYQSCETDDWESSEAHAFCVQLRSVAISKLPGYEQASWSIDTYPILPDVAAIKAKIRTQMSGAKRS